MMPGEFRLARVERLREQRLAGCERLLHEADREAGAARERRAGLVLALGRGASAAGADAEELVRGAAYRDLLREQIKASDAEIARLEGILESRRRDWRAARAQLRAVAALHERHLLARRVALRRREQLEADELAGTRIGWADPGSLEPVEVVSR